MPDGVIAVIALSAILLITLTVTMAVSRLHLKSMGDKVPSDWKPSPLVNFNAWDEGRSKASLPGPAQAERVANTARAHEAWATAKRLRAGGARD